MAPNYDSETAFLLVPTLILLVGAVGAFLASRVTSLRNELTWLSIFLIPFGLFLGCWWIVYTFIGGLPMDGPENASTYMVGPGGSAPLVEVSLPMYLLSWMLNIIISACLPALLIILFLGYPYMSYKANITEKRDGLKRKKLALETVSPPLCCSECGEELDEEKSLNESKEPLQRRYCENCKTVAHVKASWQPSVFGTSSRVFFVRDRKPITRH